MTTGSPSGVGIPVVSKEVLSQRTNDYQGWLAAYARNQKIPIEWAGKGVRKEDYVLPALRRQVKKNAYGVYFIFRSMEQGRKFRNTHYHFFVRDQVLGPIVIR